jgi:DNA adenine methylase
LERGFATFFLNRTNRSGIIRGGVIGGQAQEGKWKIDARFNKVDLIGRIEHIARYRHRVTLTNMDAAQFLRSDVSALPVKSLIYLDPPYYVKGRGLYEHHYAHRDHAEIARLLREGVGRPWVVSYDGVAPILDLYRGYRCKRYDLEYSAQDRYRGAEAMFFSPHMKIPRTANPARMRAA